MVVHCRSAADVQIQEAGRSPEFDQRPQKRDGWLRIAFVRKVTYVCRHNYPKNTRAGWALD